MGKNNRKSRLKEIIEVFLKNGIHNKSKILQNPVAIRKALEELGPTFVKIGQILSTRPDLLPKEFINEFKKLQDNVKPENIEVILGILEEEFNEDLDNIFYSFEKEPIASASIAQVHIAILPTGERVVVKVQRPGIREKMLGDIAILKKLIKIVNLTFKDTRININDVLDELWNSANNEMDFLKEADNIEKFLENNRDVKFITSPIVYKEYTTNKVLTMEYVDGIKISRCDDLIKAGYDLQEISEKLIINYLKQVFDDGFFHGDPHPGNILINGTKIAYIDFGVMGSISKSMQSKFVEFLYGVATKDIWMMTEAILKIGIFKDNINKNILYQDIDNIYNKYVEATLEEINLSEMISEVLIICKKNSITIPRDMVILMKGIMTLEGLIAVISPKISLLDIAALYGRDRIINKKFINEELQSIIKDILLSYKDIVKIPTSLNRLIQNINSSKIKVQMEYTDLKNTTESLNKMVNKLVLGMIIAALILSSALVIRVDIGSIINWSSLGFLGYTVCGVLAIYLIKLVMK